MTYINIAQAQADLYKLLAEVNANAVPVTIENDEGMNGVLIGESDWSAIQETLHLNSGEHDKRGRYDG